MTQHEINKIIAKHLPLTVEEIENSPDYFIDGDVKVQAILDLINEILNPLT